MRSFHGRKCTRSQRGGTAIILGTRRTGVQVIKHGGGDSGHRVANHQHPHQKVSGSKRRCNNQDDGQRHDLPPITGSLAVPQFEQ